MGDKVEGVFCRGDLVFAKVRGYPPWPARVEGLACKSSKEVKYSVLFFGTFERAICTENNLFHYEHHKEKYGSSRRRGFEESLQQIEEAAREVPLSPAHIVVKEEEMGTEEASSTEIKRESVPLLSENPSCDVSVDKEAMDVDWQVTVNGEHFVVKEEAIDAEETPLSEIKRETTSNPSNLIKCEDPVKDETVDVNLVCAQDSTNHSTRYPEDQDSIPKTQKGNKACGSKGHLVHNNFEETDRADGILLRGYISNGEKPPHVSCRDTGASSSCSEEKLTEHNGKEKEDQREKGGGARERGYRAQKKGKASAKKSHSEQSGRQKKNRGSLPCDTCGKSFSSKLHLEIHERIHTGERPFHCALCNKTYASKSRLVSHMKVHSDERPYKCSSCDKSFKEKIYLKIHIRVHSGEKPFICIVCEKAFTQNSTLKCHMRQHSGERPFICTECGKAFAVHSNLHTHLRTHTGERPFPCEDCGSSFTQSSSLKRHRHTVHGVASPVS